MFGSLGMPLLSLPPFQLAPARVSAHPVLAQRACWESKRCSSIVHGSLPSFAPTQRSSRGDDKQRQKTNGPLRVDGLIRRIRERSNRACAQPTHPKDAS